MKVDRSAIKVILTGASGTVGKKILEELISRDDQFQIRLLLRDSKKNRKFIQTYKEEIEVVWGILEDEEIVKQALNRQEIIIHSAALQPSNKSYDPKMVYKINVGGTKNIIAAMKNSQRIIYTSSISIYGDRLKDPNIKITDPVKVGPEDPYAESKYMAENLIKDSGLDYVIFRLSYCTSVDMLRFQPLMFDMPLETQVEIIDTRDVALAIVNSIENEEVWGRTFNLGGGEACQIRFREHLNDILEIMGLGRNLLPEEAFAKKDFHCGLFDTEEIQELLNFQEHTLEDFYEDIRKWIGFKRVFVPLVRPIVRWFLLKKSKYYSKYKNMKKT